MKTIRNKKVFVLEELPEEESEPTIELGTTPLPPQIEKFFKKWGRDYKPKYMEDSPTTVYVEVGK